ncbi:T-lymphocyte surface antigen Ly-9-like isoform X3 [Gopherus flavomarginatus]|uniref:T-lymphocyte surface antigen Ly-9-like isoform X3 n=1 Tax=Gopherus flavomarginatus TaxID=286002 RepID=UPI0021CBF407|nr:T-lymphocyte surface antigen Ly-9-like isoform X3 [Gopherus flavomarginatus]
MEMGTSWRVWLTLFLFYKAGSGRAEAGTMELSRILGDSVTFLLEIPAKQVRTVAWTVNTTRSIVTVTTGTPPNVIVLDPSYEGRVSVLESNSLQITSLRMKDTGTYGAQISTATDISNRHFLLHVYKQVPEPTVLCDSVTCVNETCNYNLHCTVRDGGDNVTYSWTHTAVGAVVPNGSILHISLSPRDAHQNVTCTAQNPVSNSTTTASAKGLCAAPTTTTTTVNSPQFQSASMAGIAVPIVIVIVVIVVIALCYVHRQNHKKALQKYTPGPAGGEEADAEKNTVYAQVGNLPLPYSRTGTPKGRLETKEDETKTIYATVQNPNQSPPQTDDEKLGKDGLESMKKGEKTIYATVSQPTQTKTTKSTDADESAATPKPQRMTEYDKII